MTVGAVGRHIKQGGRVGTLFLISPAAGVGTRCGIDAHSYRLGVVVVHIPIAWSGMFCKVSGFFE